MKTTKLLTGVALLALGVAGAATSHSTLGRQAHAQSSGSAGTSQGSDPNEPSTAGEGAKGAKESSGSSDPDSSGTSAKPESKTGTRGESGRAGPSPGPDAGPPPPAEPEKGHTNRFQQNKTNSDRDPIPPGSETASPTHRQSRPW
jgi:hypothetical protein